MTRLVRAGRGETQLFSKAFSPAHAHTSLRTSLDMYADGARTAGHHNNAPQPPPRRRHHHQRHHQFPRRDGPCQCYRCVRYEPAYPGCPPAPAHADRPSPDRGRDARAPRLGDGGAFGAFAADGPARNGHCGPQRRPVFAGPGTYAQPDDLAQGCPWDFNPAQWSYPPEPGVRHYPSVREQCGCVVWGDVGPHPFNTRPPQPLPPPQFRGQAHRRTVKYVSEAEEAEEEEEEEAAAEEDEEEGDRGPSTESYHLDLRAHGPQPGLSHVPNGHCGPKPVYFEGGQEGDGHRGCGRLKGGPEDGCNGRGAPHKVFFSTEVPQKQLNHSRRKGPYVPPPDNSSQEPSKPNANVRRQRRSSDPARQKAGQESVRDQIRQVVTDLEDVLGGLKQVHMEMKEVVEQIDRLTANIDLSEENPGITHGGSNKVHVTSHPGDLVPNHRTSSVQLSQHIDEDHIILRTNSPSPVHMASVVKTNRVALPSHCKDIGHDRPGANGHPPHLSPPKDSNHVGRTHPEPPARSIDPTVIIRNSTSGSRTQKPPPYPQNGRCGKGPCQPPVPLKNPSYPGRRRQNTSMV